MIGGLGGFVLPIAFGAVIDLTGVWTSCFMLLFVGVAVAFTWMHVAVRSMERGVAEPMLRRLPELPEMQEIHEEKHVGVLGPHLIEDRSRHRPTQSVALDPGVADRVCGMDGVVCRRCHASGGRVRVHYGGLVLARG